MKIGQLVRYTPAFCRSIGLYTPPVNGIIVDIHSPRFVKVWWCDTEPGDAMLVNTANLESDPSKMSDGMRDALLAEYSQLKDTQCTDTH